MSQVVAGQRAVETSVTGAPEQRGAAGQHRELRGFPRFQPPDEIRVRLRDGPVDAQGPGAEAEAIDRLRSGSR